MARSSNRTLWKNFLATGKKGGPPPATLPVAGYRPFEGLVLGIDPSLRATGLALLSGRNGGWRLLECRVVRLPATLDPLECLGHLQREVLAFLADHPVRHVAVEDAIFVQNFRTALTLGSARGALIGPLAAAGLPIFPYPPLRIKQAVIGYGRASKEQVRRTVCGFVGVPESSLSLDESDALAAALCHALTWRDTSA